MLWGIDPLLDADLLYALRRMGHGDEIAVVDTNYPAASNAMSTVVGRPLLMAGVSAARAVEAILSVMPLDTFVPDPAGRMGSVSQYPTVGKSNLGLDKALRESLLSFATRSFSGVQSSSADRRYGCPLVALSLGADRNN